MHGLRIGKRWLLAWLVSGLLAPAANGQTWDGGSATTSNWTDGANWSNNAALPSNGSATPNFAGSVRLTPVVNQSYDILGMTFDNGAGAFNIQSLGGSVLYIRTDGIVNNNPSVTQTVSVATSVFQSQSWSGVGPLTMTGPVGLNSSVLTLNSPAIIRLDGAVSGAGSIVKNGEGVMVVTGNNTFTGGITLNSGILAIGINVGLGTGALTINGGTVEGTGGTRTLANTINIDNDFGMLTGTAVTLSGSVVVRGNHKLTNDTTTLTLSGSLLSGPAGGELELAGSGKVTLTGTALTVGSSLRLSGGTLAAAGMINSPGSTFTQEGGTFTGSLVNRGAFVFNGGTPTGNITNEAGGEATINANLTLAAALSNAGTLRINSGRTLTFGAQTLNNTGTLELAGGTISAAASPSFINSGLISGYGTLSTTGTSLANAGQIQISGGNLTLGSNSGYSNSGQISVPQGRQLVWNSGAVFNNWGLVQLAGGTLAGTGSYSNTLGGEIRGGGRVTATLANTGGVIRATGDVPLTLTNLAGHNTAGGELRVDQGATLNIQGAFDSTGTIVVGGSAATLNLNSVNNTGVVRGEGRVTGSVLNSGVVRAEGGTLTLTGTTNTNTAQGRLEAGVGTQLFYSQGLAANAGLIALVGGAFDNGNAALANSGRIEGYGTLRTGGLTNSGSLAVGGTLDVIGQVTNSGTVNTTSGSAVRFFGPVSGAGSFTGTGTVTFLNTFSPGASPAAVSFGGDMSLDGAADLVIELGGQLAGSQYDTLSIDGTAALGGTLQVALLDNFTPTTGSVFQIVSAAGGVNGKFAAATLPTLAEGAWQLKYVANGVTLQVAVQGDFNFDGHVDAADYTLWRDTQGQGGAALAADADGDGVIGQGDYALWKANFGHSSGGSMGSPTVGAVPEPSTAMLLLAGAGLLAAFRRRGL